MSELFLSFFFHFSFLFFLFFVWIFLFRTFLLVFIILNAWWGKLRTEVNCSSWLIQQGLPRAMSYSRKDQTQMKKRGELRTWTVQGYWRESMWKLQKEKTRIRISRGVHKRLIVECPQGLVLGFWTWSFHQGVSSHSFADFPGVKSCFL